MRIDLSYSIQNFDSGKDVAVIRMLSDNFKYERLKLRAVMGPLGLRPHSAPMNPISNTKKMILSGTRDSKMGLQVQTTTFTTLVAHQCNR